MELKKKGLMLYDNQVNVPALNFVLTEEHLQELLQAVELVPDTNFGIDRYVRCVGYIEQLVSRNPHIYR